jgi:hypothetical protein
LSRPHRVGDPQAADARVSVEQVRNGLAAELRVIAQRYSRVGERAATVTTSVETFLPEILACKPGYACVPVVGATWPVTADADTSPRRVWVTATSRAARP